MSLPAGSDRARRALLKHYIGHFGSAPREALPKVGTSSNAEHLTPALRGQTTDDDDDSDNTEDTDDGDGLQGNSLASCSDPVYLKLKSIAERFEDYAQSPVGISKLEFKEPTAEQVHDLDPSLLTPSIVSGLLSPTSPATKQLEYRINGFQGLLVELSHMEKPLGRHDAQHDNLNVAISLELEKLLLSVYDERGKRHGAELEVDGPRRIRPPVSYSRYMSPIMISVVILIAIIHCMMGVSRDQCGFLLKALRCILRLVAQLDASRTDAHIARNIDAIPVTLQTALHYLDLEDKLDFYVVCPACDKLFGEDLSVPDECNGTDLDGVTCNQPLFRSRHRGNRTWRKPKRRFSHLRLERWLYRFLNRPDVEDMLESTRPMLRSPCTDFWDAPFLCGFPSGSDSNFFVAPPDELRLAFLVYHDFFNPFGNKTAGKKRSIGLVMMVCLNLPPDVRYDLKNIYITAMIPGPKEPSLEHINNFIHPIAQDFFEHFEPGVYVTKTFKHPNGRKVRSVAPVTSMDIPASRAFGGIGGQQHTIFCSFCAATLPNIDNFNLSSFPLRTMDHHRLHAGRWLSARTTVDRQSVWIDHGARHSEWLCFPWWDVFTGTTIAPLHWTKNMLEKQIRENMGCSTTISTGIPEPPVLSRPISSLEIAWGALAMKHSSAQELEVGGMPEPLLRHLCRERGIFEAGLASKRLIQELNQWRVNHFFLNTDGTSANPTSSAAVSAAKIEYYLNRTSKKDGKSLLTNNSTMPGLRELCSRFSLPWNDSDKKAKLIDTLLEYYNTNHQATPLITSKTRPKPTVAILGMEIVSEIHEDLKRTTIPSWLKTPPLNFATVDHGKLASEELKSLALVSLPVTLIRLWGSSESPYRPYLDHFLHLSVAVRILSYQSLTTHDISLFESHYDQYLAGLKTLYPFCSVVPVQHLGLHIPYFLRSLGPSARYSENTPEMFIGILEEISTNSRLGELEQTLHRELNMASNLKVMMDQQSLPDALAPFKDVVGDYLQDRYPSSDHSSSKSWQTTHDSKPMTLGFSSYEAVCNWTTKNSMPELARNLLICSKLRRGNVVYQPYNISTGNSCVLFRPRGSNIPIPGRIDVILQEPHGAVQAGDNPRILLIVRAFQPLGDNDRKLDPYITHPIMGQSRLGIMSLYYDTVEDQSAEITEPDDIVSHIAVAPFHDKSGVMSAPCIVVVDLDLKHTFAA